MQRVEQRLWPTDTGRQRHGRRRGVVYAALGVSLGATGGWVVGSTTVAVALSSAGHELRDVASRIGDAALAGGLDAARAELPSLVGRDPSQLDASGVAAAVIESVAENSVDAVVAPVFWALLAGAPGAVAYRAINTMDAMVGHRSPRYERFGTAAARLDDVANFLPARIFAALVVLVSPSGARSIMATVRRDAGAHPSPNAGVAESAMAAAIGRQLGGTLRYGERVEHRPTLGDGARPMPEDIDQAVRRAELVENLMIAVLLVAGIIGSLGRRR